MASWIYLFSKFTPESLLFEALAIFILVCTYTAFWILRKYKYGSIADAIPASVVKDGLNQLIGDAEALRAQLFGILGSAGASSAGAHPAGGAASIDPTVLAALSAQRSASSASNAGGPSVGQDPEIHSKLAAFEVKMAEQARLLETIQTEKTRLEHDLVQAKAAAGTAASGEGAGGAAANDKFNDKLNDKLKDKVANLEARLAEYSVIEDDLANLKRLQQENLQLKAALAGKTDAPTSVPPAEATAAASTTTTMSIETAPLAAPTSAVAATVEVPKPDAKASPTAASSPAVTPESILAQATTASLEAEFNAATTASTAPATPSTQKPDAAAPLSATATPNFETLVDSVEKSLQPSDSAVDSSKAGKPARAASTEKSDEDLISEFEKMLNS